MKLKYLIICLIIFVLSACQGDERLSEVSTTQTEAQINVENRDREMKARAMEMDLKRRQRFYQALKGRYEGTFKSDIGIINVRMTFSPSLPSVDIERARQLDEIVYDLNNLYLNVNIIQWVDDDPTMAVGCNISQVRPNIMDGEVIISSESCPNFYRLEISELARSSITPDETKQIVQDIASGNRNQIESVSGEIQTSTAATIYAFKLIRRDW